MIHALEAVFRVVFDDPTLILHENTSSADIPDWDSQAQLMLVLAIEEEFGVEFTTAEVAAFHSVGDFARALMARQPAI